MANTLTVPLFPSDSEDWADSKFNRDILRKGPLLDWQKVMLPYFLVVLVISALAPLRPLLYHVENSDHEWDPQSDSYHFSLLIQVVLQGFVLSQIDYGSKCKIKKFLKHPSIVNSVKLHQELNISNYWKAFSIKDDRCK